MVRITLQLQLGKDAQDLQASLSEHVKTFRSVSKSFRSGQDQAFHLAGGKAVQGFSHSKAKFLPNELDIKNPLLAAVYLCFNHQLPLALSPGVIWNTIMQGVSTHVKLHSKTYHDEFVRAEGPKTLDVRDDTLRRNTPAAWYNAWENDVKGLTRRASRGASELRRSNYKRTRLEPAGDSHLLPTDQSPEKRRDNLLDHSSATNNGNSGGGSLGKPGAKLTDENSDSISTYLTRTSAEAFKMSFSTEAKDDAELDAHDIELDAHAIVFMDVVKSYFKYHVTTRGIPSIDITGTKQDWSSIRKNLSLLEEIGLSKWKVELDNILKRFESAAGSAVDDTYDPAEWNTFFQAFGSGDEMTISGWIGSLFYYGVDEKVNRSMRDMDVHVKPEDFPSGLCETPFEWHYHGNKIEMLFRGGLVGVVLDELTDTVAPQLGWLVTEAEVTALKTA